MKTEEKNKEMIPPFYAGVELMNQARFTMVAVFRESTSYVRNYTCPFNMIGICVRAEDENASIVTNLKTGEVHHARKNEINMTPYGLSQCYHHTLKNEHLAIHFKLELFPGVDVFSGQECCCREYSPKLRKEAEEIFAIPDRVLMLSRCQAFALEYCHRHWPDHYPFELERMKRFTPVLEYIRSHGNARTSIPELAKQMHLAASTFTREFQAVFRMSPKSFLQQEIYDKASRLLLAPDATVKGVANQLQFNSEFYFSHFFHRLSGISPKDYRTRSNFQKR